MKFSFFFLCCTIAFTSSFTCRTVKKGNHYYGYFDIPSFDGARFSDTQKSIIVFDANVQSMEISTTDSKAALCMHSWNKLFGSTRCLAMVHTNSDRFVWRRPENCMKYSNGVYVGLDQNCSDINKVELAAYSYDNGREPFSGGNSDLLKIFHTLVEIGKQYLYTIKYGSDYTLFTLSTIEGIELETHEILHTSCSTYSEGFLLTWYFGGQCPAPSDVTACFKDAS